MNAHLVAPSILASNFANIEREIDMINKSTADWIHLDIMDGVFVPNISFGFPVVEQIHKLSDKPLDVHLMIVEPEKYLTRFRDAGAHVLNVHYEACRHLHSTINDIKNLGMKAGVTLNPHSSVNLLEDITGELDLVLIMSVNPGFGGQKFIENTYEKVRNLKKLFNKKKSNALIEVDGGVDFTNAKKLYDCGVDILVAGTTVFNSDNPISIIEKLKKA